MRIPRSLNALKAPMSSGSWRISTLLLMYSSPGVVATAGSMFLSGTESLDSLLTFSSVEPANLQFLMIIRNSKMIILSNNNTNSKNE
jgi:hypothetical protein